ncbi:GntR family transcriptional regulator [Loigolactobacillus zhaoyuanensis]|uniref:GntR family transcriptional regulator n=1 Tax=Loigolactobacillus zhaoyuanensis TaxID=2486017 RepID=A0ABW8UH43_9LACO|nr:GntR family transcriptional regulator [Loigolactobacillus zhaoyuanensis]
MYGNPSLPLYQSMLNDLIQRIESGQLTENQKLPSEQKLGEQYQVSRITVRRALAELEQKQYIYKKQGQGSFVLRQSIQKLGVKYVDTQRAISNMGKTPKLRLMSFNINVDGSETAIRAKLNLTEDDYFYTLTQLYFADERPVMYERIYLRYDRFPLIRFSEIQDKNLMPFLIKKYDLVAIHFKKSATASLVNAKNRKLLNANVGDPLMRIETYGESEKQLVYYSDAIVTGNLPMFLIEE